MTPAAAQDVTLGAEHCIYSLTLCDAPYFCPICVVVRVNAVVIYASVAAISIDAYLCRSAGV